MAEVVYNTGKTQITTNLIPNGATNLRARCIITSKTGADAPTLGTIAAIDAVGTVAFQNVANVQTLTSVTKAFSGNNIVWDSANLTFPAEAVTALAMVIYDATTNTDDTTRIPTAFYDTGFGAGIDITGGLNVTINNFLQLT